VLVLVSAERIRIDGEVLVRGGASADCESNPGAGGSVLLDAPVIEGDGSIDVSGGVTGPACERGGHGFVHGRSGTLGEETSFIAFRAVVHGLPGWAEASRLESSHCRDAPEDGLDAGPRAWAVTCVQDPDLQLLVTGGLASFLSRAPQPLDASSLTLVSELAIEGLGSLSGRLVAVSST